MNIKEIAEELTNEQFVELIARVCIKDARRIEDYDVPQTYERLTENAQWIFYSGMHDEERVADKIEKLLLSPEYAHLFNKEET